MLAMDIDTGALQATFLGSTHAFTTPKGTNASLSGGLMRYHSAPTSVLAGLLDDDFLPASEESEFARLLSDGIGSLSSVLDPRTVQQCDTNQADFVAVSKEQDCFLSCGSMNEQVCHYIGNNSSYNEHLSLNRLSAISECGLEESVENFCLPLSSEVLHQARQEPGQVGTPSYKPGCVAESQELSFQCGVRRQSSSPAESLSSLAMKESSDKVELGCGSSSPHLPVRSEKLAGQSMLPTFQMTTVDHLLDIKCSNVIRSTSLPRRTNVLLRHSSSPAGLLSQINLEDFSVNDKRVMEGSSELFTAESLQDTNGSIFGRGLNLGTRNDKLVEQSLQNFLDLGQRKRGRGPPDDKLPKGLQRSPIDVGTMKISSFSPSSSSSPGGVECVEGAAEESVLCRSRAKRGCATHPRSIAERQRRIKISERMKKLQDLVPNLDKQASTAEMLDEVVEYVKLLQCQVQELTLNRPKCTGSCQQQGSSPPR